ncbi:DNA primase large subunit [Nymphon striatum]|nr:DNA primase large subunit [Nymphon striatum]
MDFKKLRKKIRPSIESVNTIYNHAIQLYLCPPNVEITLEKFEEYAIERLKGIGYCHKSQDTPSPRLVACGCEAYDGQNDMLPKMSEVTDVLIGLILLKKKCAHIIKSVFDNFPHDFNEQKFKPRKQTMPNSCYLIFAVLRIVETTGLKHPRNSEEYEQTLQNELKKQGLAHYLLRVNKNESSGEIDEDGFNARQRDHVSHYILRLSYCQSELLRKWFITQETDLFRFRYQRESGLSQQKFLKLNSFQYEPISQEEKRQFYQEILDSTYSIRFYASSLESEEFKLYKVPFTEVLDLISSRKVLVKSGFAYIPQPDLISVLINTFKTKLSHALSAPHVRERYNAEIQRWISKGWLKEWRGPIEGIIPLLAVFQPSKDKVRPVMDYRELNDFVECHTGDVIAVCGEKIREWRQLRGELKIVDLKSAYLQIHISENLWKYQVVKYKGVTYALTRLGFGLSCAPRIMTAILGKVLSMDERVRRGTDHYIDDIVVRESVLSAQELREHLARYGLESKAPEGLDGGRVLGISLRKGSGGHLEMSRGMALSEIVMGQSRLTKRGLFSLCGRLVGHYPVAGWLRPCCSFLKRLGCGGSWDEPVESSVGELANELLVRARAEDPVRGRWHVSPHGTVTVWTDASSLGMGVALEVDGSVAEDASWLRKESDHRHINVAELEAVARGINLAISWGFKTFTVATDSRTVISWMDNTVEGHRRVRTKGASEMLIKRRLGVIRDTITEFGLTVTVRFVSTTENKADRMTRVPKKWLGHRDTGEEGADVSAALATGESVEDAIWAAHLPHHLGVDRTLYLARQIRSNLTREQVKRELVGCEACQRIDPARREENLVAQGSLAVDGNWRRVAVDVTHYGAKHYLSMVDCGPSRFAIWRRLSSETAASIIAQLQGIVIERGPCDEFLLDNSTAFRSAAVEQFADEWGISLRFRAAYAPSGNGIVERNHRTIKRIAERGGISPEEATFWYNVTPRKDTDAGSVPSNGLYRYTWRVPFDVNLAKVESFEDSPFAVGDEVWVKPPIPSCTRQWSLGIVSDVVSRYVVRVDGMPRHVKDIRKRRYGSNRGVTTKRALPVLEEDERLLPIISGLSERYVGKDYGAEQSGDEITPSMVDDFSKKSFPLCMRILHETLRRDNHLKHGSRLQYSLFLKGIGMTLEGVLQMWKAEFIKTMDGDKNLFKHFICLFSPSFDKQYSYGLRHSFGKEGKRVNYTPYNCMRIITSNAPAAGDTHGCPFKHINKSLLEKRLKGYDIHDSDTQKIMEQVNQGNYQIACSQYFEVMHKSANAEIHIIHPNQYFTESRNVAAGKFTSDPKINVKTTRSVMYPNKMEGPDDSVFMEFGMSSKELDDLTNKAEEVEEVCTLKLKYARLLKENGALKTVISNVNALPNLNEMVLNLQDAVNTLTNSRFSLPESPLLQNCPPSTHCTSSETSSPYDSSECDDNQVTIYPGLVVMKAQKKLRDMRSDAKSYIYSLMAMLWSRDVLSTHSLTSKRSNAHKDKVPKPCLDPDMVKQLSDLVSKKFNVDERQIKIHIKAKLNNVEKCHNIRRQFNF